MNTDDIKDVLYEIKGDVKDVRKAVIKQGNDISQLKVWAWVSRSTMLAIVGTMVTWVKSKVG
jgi:hypothetical protein